ncbi:MAG: polyprenyl synthetase family protein [Myxococcota bacterium]|nr:polyprenyl synthetase family protein [Myxococcota bacterium]
MSDFEARVEQLLAAESGPLGFALRYHFARPGKRARARLALAAGCALGVPRPASVDLAVACELLHEASLVHDDIQDRDATRRGQPAVWALLGEDLALNVGDHLLTRAIDVAARLRAPAERRSELVCAFTRHTLEAVRGQVRDNTAAGDPSFDVADYEALARAKTGSLLTIPVEGALVLAQAPPRLREVAREALGTLGVAYQTQDDLAELFGLDLDHDADADVETGRPNAAIVHFLGTCSVEQRSRFQAARTHDEVELWMHRVRRSRATAGAAARAREHYARARALFAELPARLSEVLCVAAERMSRPLDEIERLQAALGR